MAKFFPTVEVSRAARDVYRSATIGEAMAALATAGLSTPHTNDMGEMIEEFCTLLDELGVPDRDGADFAVIVPIVFNGVARRSTVTLDFGRRLLAVVNHPVLGSGPVPPEVFVSDVHLPQNLQHELLAVLVTYKTER